MEVKFAKNRVTISFSLSLFGNENVNTYNNILRIAKQHDAQINIYCNKPAFIEDTPQMGSFGGGITFHDHSCNPYEAYKDLFNYILPYIGNRIEYSKEVELTHRKDGSAYKRPQTIIVSCDENGNELK